MTFDELREKIAKMLCQQFGEDTWDTLPLKRPSGRASYLGLYKEQFYPMADRILTLFREAGWVQLAEDQTLPLSDRRGLAHQGYTQAQQDMLKAGFRRVKHD